MEQKVSSLMLFFLLTSAAVWVILSVRERLCCMSHIFYIFFAAGMNGFLKAEFSNMWTAILQNKESFKRPISELMLSYTEMWVLPDVSLSLFLYEQNFNSVIQHIHNYLYTADFVRVPFTSTAAISLPLEEQFSCLFDCTVLYVVEYYPAGKPVMTMMLHICIHVCSAVHSW